MKLKGLIWGTNDPTYAKYRVILDVGYYEVDTVAKTAVFHPDRDAIEEDYDFDSVISVYTRYYSSELDKLEGYNVSGDVRHYVWGSLTDGVFTIQLDYLDTTNGEIKMHGHPSGDRWYVTEAYLAAEAPYIGTVCTGTDKHRPFAKKTIAVKVITAKDTTFLAKNFNERAY